MAGELFKGGPVLIGFLVVTEIISGPAVGGGKSSKFTRRKMEEIEMDRLLF